MRHWRMIANRAMQKCEQPLPLHQKALNNIKVVYGYNPSLLAGWTGLAGQSNSFIHKSDAAHHTHR